MIANANTQLAAAQASQQIASTGADADAVVMSVTDSGMTQNTNIGVVLVLNVTTAQGQTFQTAGNAMVPRINVPRVGDKVKIKYNPANPSVFAIVG